LDPQPCRRHFGMRHSRKRKGLGSRRSRYRRKSRGRCWLMSRCRSVLEPSNSATRILLRRTAHSSTVRDRLKRKTAGLALRDGGMRIFVQPVLISPKFIPSFSRPDACEGRILYAILPLTSSKALITKGVLSSPIGILCIDSTQVTSTLISNETRRCCSMGFSVDAEFSAGCAGPFDAAFGEMGICNTFGDAALVGTEYHKREDKF